MLMFKRLRNKFLILNMLVTSLVMLTAFVLVFLTTYSNTRTEIENRLGNVSGSFVMNNSIETELSESGLPVHQEENEMMLSSHKVTSDYIPSFTITVDRDGNITEINSVVDISNEQYIAAAQTAWNEQGESNITINGRIWIYRVAPIQITYAVNGEMTATESPDIYQISFLDITDMQKNLSNLMFTFLFVGIGMLAVIFVISIFFANRAIQPIAESWEKQKQFIADASHELKTPLTTIMTNCDVLEANEDDTIKSQREWLDYIRIGTDRMSKLSDDSV